MDRRSLLPALTLAAACAGAPGPPATTAAGPPAPLFVEEVPALGEETAPALLVPGAAWLSRDLDPLAAGRRLVFFDPRGRGRSPRPAPAGPKGTARTLEDDVADLERLRVRLGLERMALLGWFSGGGLAVRYALRYPERVERLVLVSPLPARRHGWRAYLGAFVDRAGQEPQRAAFQRVERMRANGSRARDPEEYARRVTRASLLIWLADPADAARMRSDPVAREDRDPDAGARIARGILEGLGDWDWTAELATLDLPVLVVHGEAGLLAASSAEAYVEACPRARLLSLPGVGMMPWLEDPDSFFAAVLAFLDEASVVEGDRGDGRR